MSNSKKGQPKEKRAKQNTRSRQNRIKKYEKLIKQKPNDPHRSKWESILQKFNSS